jgi:mobilization protein NikA
MTSSQNAFWNHYTIYNTHQDDRPKRSEKRQRTKRVTVRLLPAERAVLELVANEAHMSLAEYLRSNALHNVHDTTSDTRDAATVIEAVQSE